jgi:hypothetical protein
MTEKLYLYDVVDAAPRFFVRGSTVCKLSGEPTYAIEGEKRTMVPVGGGQAGVQDQRRMDPRLRPRRVVVVRHGQDFGSGAAADRRDQPDRVTRLNGAASVSAAPRRLSISRSTARRILD